MGMALGITVFEEAFAFIVGWEGSLGQPERSEELGNHHPK